MLFLSVHPNLFLVQSRSLSGHHVSISFSDPVFGADEAGSSLNTEVFRCWMSFFLDGAVCLSAGHHTYLEGTPNGHHILPPFQPPKIGPLNCHICQHQHSGNLHTKLEREREREKKDVCNIYVYIWVYIDTMHVCIRGYLYISTYA